MAKRPLITELFRPDCLHWAGYWPCPVQRRTDIPHCAGCTHHTPAPVVGARANRIPYDPGMLASAARVGLIEMGGLGSHLRTTAVTRAIRERNPDVQIVWFTHRRGAELLAHVPSVVPINTEDTVPEDFVRDLDVLINLEFDHARPLLAQARCVAGFDLNAYDRFEPASRHAEPLQRLQIDNTARAANTLTMQRILLDTIGLHDAPARYDDLILPAPARAAAEHRLSVAFPSGRPTRRVGLFIGSSQKGTLKRWPATSWVTLAARLATAGLGVVVLAGPDEQAEVLPAVVAGLPDTVAVVADASIGEFLALVGRLDAMITADTLALHAAAAQHVPVVALAGPMPANELELAATDRIIGPTLPCGPCYLRCTRLLRGECMTRITVDQVAVQVDAVLRRLPHRPRITSRQQVRKGPQSWPHT